jgi:Uma2 family endonuclease
MSQQTPVPPYRLDPDDPRAPTVEQWAAMSEPERAAVVDALPTEFEPDEAHPPEGDEHRTAKELATEALRSFFERTGRRVYVSAELPVYYPHERMFAPDVIAVTDVEPHTRSSWVVSREGKGLEFALEIIVSGRRRKDLLVNPARYARLGINEYFVLDVKREALWGWRLPDEGGVYASIAPVRGALPSRVLGLELSLEGGRLRFFHGPAALLQASELIARLERAVNEQTQKRHEEANALQEENLALQQALSLAEAQAAQERERAAQERERAAQERERASQEREQRQGAEERLVEALAEIERLRRERAGEG